MLFYTFYKQWGNNILFSYVDEDGQTHHTKIDNYKPYLYSRTDDEGDAKSIFGYPLKQINFDNIKAAKSFYEQYKDVEGMTVEGNFKFANQFAIELCEGKTPKYETRLLRGCILDIEVTAPEFPKPQEAKYPIDAITFYDIQNDKYMTYGLGAYDHNKDDTIVQHLNVSYVQCASEVQLLGYIIEYLSSGNFHYTSGWNSEIFDMPYIVNRIVRVLGEKAAKRLSPYKIINRLTVKNDYSFDEKIDIVGLPHLDYMNLYKKHIFTPRESYSLNFIASVELGDEKLSYDEVGSLAELSKQNFQKYISYNIVDVDIIRRLDLKLGLFELTYTLAYFCVSNLEDTLGTVRIWEQLIAKELYARQIVPLCSPVSDTYRPYPGGYVSEPQVGRHKWVGSFDLNSLYPHIEMQINISPETFITRQELPSELLQLQDELAVKDIDRYYQQVMNLVNEEVDLSVLKKHNVSMSAGGQFYRKDIKGIIPLIKEEIYKNRKGFKKKMLEAQQKLDQLKDQPESDEYLYWQTEESKNNNLQMAMKILLNSGYGALANKHFTYFRVENAESITTTGQMVNRWSSERTNDLLNQILDNNPKRNYIVNNDTDSVYLEFDDVAKVLCPDETDLYVITDKLDRFLEEVISPEIVKQTQALCDYLNNYENKMVWEREVISPASINVAKKRYAMHVTDSEGVRFTTPKLKVIGLDSKRSSTPAWAKKGLEHCYELALKDKKDEMHEYIIQFEKDFYKLPVSDIAMPRSVSSIEKYMDGNGGYIKGTPKHVKAAILHNRIIDERGLTHIDKLKSGNKFKFVELVKPNPYDEDVVGFLSFLPSEFELEPYINRQVTFEAGFLKPLSNFLDSIHWSTEEKVDLFDF